MNNHRDGTSGASAPGAGRIVSPQALVRQRLTTRGGEPLECRKHLKSMNWGVMVTSPLTPRHKGLTAMGDGLGSVSEAAWANLAKGAAERRRKGMYVHIY